MELELRLSFCHVLLFPTALLFCWRKMGPESAFMSQYNTIKQKQHRRGFVSLFPSSRVDAGRQWSWISRPSWSCSLGLARSTIQYQFTLKMFLCIFLLMLLQFCWLWPVKCYQMLLNCSAVPKILIKGVSFFLKADLSLILIRNYILRPPHHPDTPRKSGN